MNDATRDLMARLERLERTAVTYRAGEITDDSPLTVALGGASEGHDDVRAVSPSLAVGDVAAVLVFGNDLLVLGSLSGTPSEVRGQTTATGTGAAAADVTVTDNLGTTSKHATATHEFGGTFGGDVIGVSVFSKASNTTTFRVWTRGGGNITASQTVFINYRIWPA